MQNISRAITAFVALMCALLGAPQTERLHEDDIRVEHINAKTVLYRNLRGEYSQHGRVIGDLNAYAAKQYPRSAGPTGSIVGIYPHDPDVVPSTDLAWEIGLVLDASEGSRPPTAPYRKKTLPAVDAAVLDSNVGNAGLDGLAMQRWLLEHGYAQIAPTRMEYGAPAADPRQIRTRIVIPVVKRVSGLALAPR